MQFLVLGYDGDDSGAKERRQAARPAHIALGNDMVQRGEAVFGAALLNEAGDMVGSAYIVDFPDQNALDAWLAREPYVTGQVWKRVEVKPCRTGPSFEHLFPKKL